MIKIVREIENYKGIWFSTIREGFLKKVKLRFDRWGGVGRVKIKS